MKKFFLILHSLFLIGVVFSVSSQAQSFSALELNILNEINRVRSNPQAYAKWIEDNRSNLAYTPQPQNLKAVDEAIRALKSSPNLPQITPSPLAYKAAKAHLDEQLPTGTFSHNGKDGSTVDKRLKRVGKLPGAYAENAILLNPEDPATAQRVVLIWIIDDIVSNRAHRKVLLDKNYLLAGIACGKFPNSKTYKDYSVCVADFAAQLY
jgi:uncharacterized protein YkwD